VTAEPGGERTVHRTTLRSKRQGSLASGGELLFEIPVEVGDPPDARVLVEVERLTAAGTAPERLATFDVTEALEAGPGRAIDREVRLARQAESPRSGHGE
jgi:hypothetical protein